MSQTSQRPKKVGDLVSDKIDLSRHVVIHTCYTHHIVASYAGCALPKLRVAFY